MNIKCEEITDLKDMLLKATKQYGDKILYESNNKEITYQEMQNKVNNLGTSLIEMDLKDKNIAIISENRYEWEIAYFAITCGTGVVVPLDKSLTKTEIKTILKRAEIQAIFCSKKFEDVLIEIKQELEQLKYIISFDKEENDVNINSFNKIIEFGKKMIDSGNNTFIDAKIDNKKVGAIMFTSGTTEKSKAVMLSHKNICSNLMNVEKVFPLNSEDIALSVLPLNHVLEGLFCLLLTIYKGAKRVYCNDLKDIIEDMNKYQISFMGAVPAIYEYIYKRINELNKENINIFMSGGASLESKLEEAFDGKGINLVQGYGITETAPVISMSNKEIHKIGSVGKVIPNVEVKLINKDEDGIGEVAVSGENIFLGYYQDIKSTIEVLKNEWFYTGDLAKIDEDGYIFLYGRIKNMIVLPNGKKVFPEEIEALINKIDGVKESFIFDRKSKENKVNICAKIVCEKLNEKENILKEVEMLNKILPQYKRINNYYITDVEILKTPTGKIRRKEEIEKINFNNQEEKLYDYRNGKSITDKVKNILVKQLGINLEEIAIDSDIVEDLGADSLDKVEIIFALEKEFKVKILKEESMKIKKVKDILEYLQFILLK